jgi:uncharacterized delta-60 repeat protein
LWWFAGYGGGKWAWVRWFSEKNKIYLFQKSCYFCQKIIEKMNLITDNQLEEKIALQTSNVCLKLLDISSPNVTKFLEEVIFEEVKSWQIYISKFDIRKCLIFTYLFFTTFLVLSQTNNSFDSTFNQKGFLILPITSTHSEANGLVIQNDGKILVCGTLGVSGVSKIIVLRLNIDGTFDETFGTNGIFKWETYIGTNESYSIFVQPDEKIVVIGTVWHGNNSYDTDMLCLRLNTNGTLDSSFNSIGFNTISLGQNFNEEAYSGSLLNDNRIIICGSSLLPGSGINMPMTAMFLPNGKIDSSFADNGIGSFPINSDVSGFFREVSVQNDGNLLLLGNFYENIDSILLGVKISPSGNIIKTYAENGFLKAGNSNVAFLMSSGQDVNSNTFSCGYLDNAHNYDPIVMAFNQDGLPLSTFGDKGIVFLNKFENEILRNLKIQEDGKILICGTSTSQTSSKSQIYLTRLLKNGLVDSSFAENGKKIISLDNSYNNEAHVISLQSNGKILLAGSSRLPGVFKRLIAVLRFNNEVPINTIEISIANEVILFPCPVKHGGKLSIVGLNKFQFNSYEILTITGKAIHKNYFQNQYIEIPENIHNGIYFLKLNYGRKSIVKSILID